MSEYDKEVTTITDILKALDKFENKEEIIEAIKRSLYDIETDWHMEDLLRIQLQAYKEKEDKLREYCKELNLSSVSEDIEQILNEGDK